MSLQKCRYAAWLAATAAVGLFSFVPIASADPDSAFFSNNMLVQQDKQERESQPGGAWNSAQVNLPSYLNTAATSFGTPLAGLDAVNAGQGIATGGSLSVIGATNGALHAALSGQAGALGTVTGSGGGGPAAFSGGSAGSAAVGGALGALGMVP